MVFKIILAPEADDDLRNLRAFHRSAILDAIDRHLQYAPTSISRSRIKRLRLKVDPFVKTPKVLFLSACLLGVKWC